jgi:nitronate monooxygenase
MNNHEAVAPLGYPEVHWLTGPLRAASVLAGDPDGINVWAGTGYRQAGTGSVATLMDLISHDTETGAGVVTRTPSVHAN